ncbi:MAG: hypothetical protein CO141_03295 [Candidatus Moranbacteria bacterium CG_4_9_14_3_um_filter_42_9]|nr:MAG: hypothetical protein CO141_03295 [Candidatus Moranbacteria bacterium CG_4_9_14_3_um_filter_42_9]
MVNSAEFFFKKIIPEVPKKEKDVEFAGKCRRLVVKVLKWAEKSGVEIMDMKKLSGGFKNPIILIETTDGRSFVAKGFIESGEAGKVRQAQKTFDKISDDDEKFIPEVVAWLDDETLISEKTEGKTIEKKIRMFARGEVPPEEVESDLYALGDASWIIAREDGATRQ